MKYLFLFIIALFYQTLSSQQYFSKSYDPFDHNEDGIRNIIIEDSIIYASCRGACDSNKVECFKFAKFNVEGNYIEGYEDKRFETGFGFEYDEKYLYVDGGNEPFNTKLIAQRINKDDLKNDILEFIQDSSLSILNISSISNSNHFISYGSFEDLNDLYDNEPKIKTISKWINKETFSLDTTIIIPVIKRWTTVHDAAADKYGNIYFACTEKLDNENDIELNYTRILKYSPKGEMLWDYVYPFHRPAGASPSNIAIVADKVVFEGYKLGQNNQQKDNIICLDIMGNILWETEIEEVGSIRILSVLRIKKSNDGNILLCGYERSVPQNWVYAGFMMKLDIIEGKVLWERVFEVDKGQDYWGPQYAKQANLRDLEELPNGDIVGAGSISNSFEDPINGLRPDGDLWLIRVDSNGCLEPGCGLVQSIQNGIVQKDSCKWLEDNPTWHYTPWSTGESELLHKIEVVRDTTLGNRVCSIIGVTENGTYVPESELIVFYEWEREEVYFYENEHWKKLFDFSWSVFPGDTVEFYLPQNFKYYDISSSRGSFTPSKKPYYYRVKDFEWKKIENINYKTQLILHLPNEDGDCFDMADVTEGIGSKHGFMGRSCHQLTGGSQEYFRCFSSDQVEYVDVEECVPPLYVWFGEESAEWHHCLVPDGFEPFTWNIRTKVTNQYTSGDTTFSLVSGYFFGHSSSLFSDSITLLNLNDKVYYTYGDSLWLLYDFGVQSGDTLSLRFPKEMEPTWFDENPDVSEFFKIKIDSISNIEIDGEQLKRIYFDEIEQTDLNGDFLAVPTNLGDFYTEKFGYENFILPYVVTGYDENNTSCDLKTYSDIYIDYENEEAYCYSLNVKDNLDDILVIKPNPTTGIVEILNLHTEIKLIKIYDIFGQKIMESSGNILDLSKESSGTYLIIVLDKANNQFVKRIIKI